jgi:hypothetical protein
LLARCVGACEPELGIGTWTCASTPNPAGPVDAGVVLPLTDPVASPWSTGFEDGFCGYRAARGFCYTNSGASSEITTERSHSGQRSAKFSVVGTDGGDGLQARCVREGTLPQDAYYGAWYYVPAFAANTDDWNLIHFQTGDQSSLHKLWDVSLGSTNDGGLYLYLFDFLRGMTRIPAPIVKIPIGSWFHVEFHLFRAADTAGAFGLYQDGAPLIEKSGISTDDGQIGQFYVGNLADALTPPESTVYVDDVSISASLQ